MLYWQTEVVTKVVRTRIMFIVNSGFTCFFIFFFFFFLLFLLLRLLKIGFKFCCFQRHQLMTVLNFNPTSAVFIYKYNTLDGRPGNFCSGLMKLSCILSRLLSLSGHFVSLRWVILSPKKFWQELFFFSKESCWQLTPKMAIYNRTLLASFIHP